MALPPEEAKPNPFLSSTQSTSPAPIKPSAHQQPPPPSATLKFEPSYSCHRQRQREAMLVRSASTPVLRALHASSGRHSSAVHYPDSSPTVAYHPPPISCSLSSAGASFDHERSRDGTGGGLRRACSDGSFSMLGGRADNHHHHGALQKNLEHFGTLPKI
jgi:hypothetical protein